MQLTIIVGAGSSAEAHSQPIHEPFTPKSAQIRFFVIKLALDSLIRKVKENTEVFQIPPIPPLLQGGT